MTRCTAIAPGSFAEYAAAREAKLARKPANLSFDAGRRRPVSAGTALQALIDAGSVQTGQSVLIIGASGGVGSYAVQLAKAFGAEVTGVCSTAKPDLVSVARRRPRHRLHPRGLRRRHPPVRPHPRHRRQPLALPTPQRTDPDGTLVIVGGEEGGKWTGGFGRSLRAPLLSPFVRQRLTMLASKERASDHDRLTPLIEAGKVTPSIDRTYPLDRVPQAMRHLETGRVRGKVVITI